MKGYYITFKPSSENNDNGVWKKVYSQIEALNKSGLETKLFNFNIPNLFEKIQSKICPQYFIKHLPNDFFSGDFYYIRYCFSNIPFIALVKKIKKRRNCKIIIEIPTYPYYKEFQGCLTKLTLLLDIILSRQLKYFIDRIATYSKDEIIFGTPAIQIVNGIDCSLISVKNKVMNEDKSFHLIAVAKFSTWHGYDRLITGLNTYYKNEVPQKVYIHFVGDGPETDFLKNLVQRYNLSEYVIFYGLLEGEKLADVFNKADIAVCSLGAHRTGIFLGSFLKSREYLARGIPMISSTKIDILPPEFKYCYYVPEDESPIVIQDIIEFYQKLVRQKSNAEMTSEIRQFAEDNCDMSKTMLPIIDYLNRNEAQS